MLAATPSASSSAPIAGRRAVAWVSLERPLCIKNMQVHVDFTFRVGLTEIVIIV